MVPLAAHSDIGHRIEGWMLSTRTRRPLATLLLLAGSILIVRGSSGDVQRTPAPATPNLALLRSRLSLESRVDQQTGLTISQGTFAVPEDRASGRGRLIRLAVVVLRARSATPRPDPVFVFAGGPGADATQSLRGYLNSWQQQDRDIVLVSQRGTGGDNRLGCSFAVDDDNVQGYLDPLFRDDVFKPCLEELKRKFDLAKYSTFAAADDYDEVRQALGYDRINVTGGSYGTRMALVYMRQHAATVRTAILNGVVPLANKNPLYHAANFDLAVRALIGECAADADCRAAVPNLDAEFRAVLARLDARPAMASVTHPVSKARVAVTLSKTAFLEALRVVMYSGARNRQVPMLVHRAFEGDFDAFAEVGLSSERGLRRALALGQLLSVTCAEDVDRITEQEIATIAGATLAGDGRVRDQKKMCAFWPRSAVPKDHGDPVGVNVPTLLLSGTLDPVTPPRWGDEAASHLPRSLHLVVPGAHGVGGPCLTGIERRFLDSGTVERLDVSCAADLRPSRFQLAIGR
jgi:pimeloyl-ACP methyl ester carboxylesterase